MYPEGMLYVFGSVAFWRQIVAVLDQVYPHELYSSHFADDQVWYALSVPLPVGSVYTQLSALSSLGVSGRWFSWDVVSTGNYSLQDGQWAF